MKRLLLVILFDSLFLPLPVLADTVPTIIISEVQTSGASSDDEFIELYNPGSSTVNLSDYALRRKTKGDTSALGTSVKSFSSSDTIGAKEYFLWANSKSVFKDLADATTTASLTDDNSLALVGKNNVIVDTVTYGSGHAAPFSPTVSSNPDKKQSLVRDLDTLEWQKSSAPTPTNGLGVTYEEPTPSTPSTGSGQAGSGQVGSGSSTPTTSSAVRLNELLPNPKEKGEKNEYIELYNSGSDEVSLANWTLRDASKTGKYVFPSTSSIAGHGYLVITRETSGLSLNNSDETVSLFDASGTLVSSVRYDKTKENISLNYSEKGWRGSKFLTPGAENILNSLPDTKERIPKKGYAKMPVEFHAKGKDKDGDKLKYTWDFGDGHKSYKRDTAHTYKKKGKYTIRLTVTDGSEDTVETKKIKIEKYEYPDLKITTLSPNPAGSDTENEWIVIENKGKKKVNLKDFAIATGWKSLANHPIRSDLVIKPGKTLKLSRKDALFTLPNKQGKIELRAPDGKTLQKVKYQLAASVKENTVYHKEKNLPWAWKQVENVSSPQNAPSLTAKKETSSPAPEKKEEAQQTKKEEVQPETSPTEQPSIPPTETAPTLPIEQEQPSSFTHILETIFSSLNGLLNRLFGVQ